MLELARSDPDQPYTGGRSVFTHAVCRIRRQLTSTAADAPLLDAWRLELPDAALDEVIADTGPSRCTRDAPLRFSYPADR